MAAQIATRSSVFRIYRQDRPRSPRPQWAVWPILPTGMAHGIAVPSRREREDGPRATHARVGHTPLPAGEHAARARARARGSPRADEYPAALPGARRDPLAAG